jgi:hypothetical protein
MPMPGRRSGVVHFVTSKARETQRESQINNKPNRASSQSSDARHECAQGLQQRVNKAVRRNEAFSRLADHFTLLNKGLISDREVLRWVVLDPATATLEIWDRPTEDDEAYVEPSTLIRFSKACSSSAPPKAPVKTFHLGDLRNVDSNPHFWNIFLGFQGCKTCCCLTAPSQEVFDEWMLALNGYDVFDSSAATKSRPCLKDLPVFPDLLSR